MSKDLRSRNEYFSPKSISQYFREYSTALDTALKTLDLAELEKAHTYLELLRVRLGRLFVGGNGGSAAISDHLNCDFKKGIYTETQRCFKVQSLVGSMALVTALGNDLGYDQTLVQQLRMAELNSTDALLLISSSGNSENIVQAAKYAVSVGATLIGFTGFDGGALKDLSTIKLHVNFNNYGVVEDAHQTLMHVIAQYHYVHNA